MIIDMIEDGEFRGRPAVSVLILYPNYTNFIIARCPQHQAAVILSRLVDFIDRRSCVIECDEYYDLAICAIKRAFQRNISFQCRRCAMEKWISSRNSSDILWKYSDIVRSFSGDTDNSDERIGKAIVRLLYAKGIDCRKSLEKLAFIFMQKDSV